MARKRAIKRPVRKTRGQVPAPLSANEAGGEQGQSTGIRLKLIAAFAAVLAMHILWSTFFGGESASCGVEGMEDDCGPLERYLETGGFWMGLSYATALAFVAFAWMRFRESQARSDENAALGGLGLTGGLAFFGCFLLGCCGSPMLAVYIGLAGAQFLPLARPLVLGVTVATVAYGVYRIKRNQKCNDCGRTN